jgi:hypothetical protein
MKTPVQELIEMLKVQKGAAKDKLSTWIAPSLESYYVGVEKALYDAIVLAESMLEKEKEVMCDFVEYCDEANRNYQETEESWCEDLTIDDMFDKRFNTKRNETEQY